MAHYGQTVAAEWLLLTGYRHLPMSYLTQPLATIFFPTKQRYWSLPQILGLQIAAKPVQVAMWSLLTAQRNLTTPYPTVKSPTPYRHLFSKKGVPKPPTRKILHVARQYGRLS